MEATKHGFIHFHLPMAHEGRSLSRTLTWPGLPEEWLCRRSTDSSAWAVEASMEEGPTASSRCWAQPLEDGEGDPDAHAATESGSETLFDMPATPSTLAASPAASRRSSFSGLGALGSDSTAKPSATSLSEKPERQARRTPFKALGLPAWALELAASASKEHCEDSSSWYSPSPCSLVAGSPRATELTPGTPLAAGSRSSTKRAPRRPWADLLDDEAEFASSEQSSDGEEEEEARSWSARLSYPWPPSLPQVPQQAPPCKLPAATAPRATLVEGDQIDQSIGDAHRGKVCWADLVDDEDNSDDEVSTGASCEEFEMHFDDGPNTRLVSAR